MTKRNAVILILVFASGICFISSFSSGAEKEYPHPYTLVYGSNYKPPFIPPDNPMTKEGVLLGRLLFYDPALSLTGKMSCASCHQQKLFFTDGRPTAIGVHGDTLKRNTMSIVNMAWEKYFFWDGRDTSLEEVVKDHINNRAEMGAVGETELLRRLNAHKHYTELFKQAFPNEEMSVGTISKAIAQFTRTIILNFPNGPEESKKNGSLFSPTLLTEESHASSIARAALMQCNNCHGKAAGGQTIAVYENDTVYKAPTLVNIKYTGPYMHDGRFSTLREVFEYYNDHLENIKSKNPHLMKDVTASSVFTDYDLEHADAVFSGNADSSITTNPEFSDPFSQKGFKWNSINKLATGY